MRKPLAFKAKTSTIVLPKLADGVLPCPVKYALDSVVFRPCRSDDSVRRVTISGIHVTVAKTSYRVLYQLKGCTGTYGEGDLYATAEEAFASLEENTDDDEDDEDEE